MQKSKISTKHLGQCFISTVAPNHGTRSWLMEPQAPGILLTEGQLGGQVQVAAGPWALWQVTETIVLEVVWWCECAGGRERLQAEDFQIEEHSGAILRPERGWVGTIGFGFSVLPPLPSERWRWPP